MQKVLRVQDSPCGDQGVDLSTPWDGQIASTHKTDLAMTASWAGLHTEPRMDYVPLVAAKESTAPRHTRTEALIKNPATKRTHRSHIPSDVPDPYMKHHHPMQTRAACTGTLIHPHLPATLRDIREQRQQIACEVLHACPPCCELLAAARSSAVIP